MGSCSSPLSLSPSFSMTVPSSLSEQLASFGALVPSLGTCGHIHFSQGKDLCALAGVAPDTGPQGSGPRRGALITCTVQINHTKTSAHPMAFPKREEFIAGRGYLEKAKI